MICAGTAGVRRTAETKVCHFPGTPLALCSRVLRPLLLLRFVVTISLPALHLLMCCPCPRSTRASTRPPCVRRATRACRPHSCFSFRLQKLPPSISCELRVSGRDAGGAAGARVRCRPQWVTPARWRNAVAALLPPLAATALLSFAAHHHPGVFEQRCSVAGLPLERGSLAAATMRAALAVAACLVAVLALAPVRGHGAAAVRATCRFSSNIAPPAIFPRPRASPSRRPAH